MQKVKFSVSSKMARLIGRENISDSNGAIIELVKNAYDADSTAVYLEFNIIFESVPQKLEYLFAGEILSREELDIILGYYELYDGELHLKNEKDMDNPVLEQIFYNKNSILIFDNGTGMNSNIIRDIWMNIGTNDKEINYSSRRGRIKTGAKGIGRFALEKLSLKTTVISKAADSQLVCWMIDWSQFDKIDTLDGISADYYETNTDFETMVKKYIDVNILNKDDFKFDSGTLIVLQGTRENWNEKIFERINKNLGSINPLGSVDRFNIKINNIVKPQFNFETQNTSMDDQDYDYRIIASYDGNKNVNIILKRNEVDLKAKKHTSIINEKTYVYDLSEFWNRSKLKEYPYRKEDYNDEICYNYSPDKLVGGVPLSEFQKIGKFDLDIYFLKSGNSDFGFVKKIKTSQRKKLLNSFSGIKIYRDNFKVRPYGEDGPMYDWLGLGGRAQKSPAAVTHSSGAWRVFTYQLIGSVHIGRKDNPMLKDMANRESLALNDTYYLFTELINSIIAKFEYDRQYIYREFKKWLDEKEEEIDKSAKIEEDVILEKEHHKKKDNNYKEDEYRNALYSSYKKREKKDETYKIMMNFSSAGVTANTFAHELKAVRTDFSGRSNQLKICIDELLDHKEYQGEDFLNPYIEIEQNRKNDILISKWLMLVMDSVSKDSLRKKTISIKKFIGEICDDWEELLSMKSISLIAKEVDDFDICVEKINLFILFNNIILNSSYYLENFHLDNERQIIIKTYVEKEIGVISITNNGPGLDEKFSDCPDMIFEIGETSKNDGTGLGLWICKTVLDDIDGDIKIGNVEKGFELIITIPLEEMNGRL